MRKTEKLTWFAQYSGNRSGRTTRISAFDTLREARAFAEDVGLPGYITRHSDGGANFDASAARVTFVEYFGGFVPSAQEARSIESITGEAAP